MLRFVYRGGVLDSTGEAESVLQAVEHDHVKTGKAINCQQQHLRSARSRLRLATER